MRVQDYLKKPMRSVSSLGQALTNNCDMNCPHCYSRQYVKTMVSIEQCKMVLAAFPNVKEINFGTGETHLNHDFLKIFSFYREKGIRLALTTNGNTLLKMTDEEITSFLSEIDISLDFPKQKLHDLWRANGAFKNAIAGIERAKRLNLNVSIALALTNKNYRYLPGFAKLLDKYDIILRINIYKPINKNPFQLSYEEFWEAMALIADNFGVAGNSEPILSLVLPEFTTRYPCSHSFRIHTDLTISGCVYLSNERIKTSKFLKLSKRVPDFCLKCKVLNLCRGGCLSRRILQVGPANPDFYCPIAKGRKVPKLKFKKSRVENLMHLNYLCTILLSRRFI